MFQSFFRLHSFDNFVKFCFFHFMFQFYDYLINKWCDLLFCWILSFSNYFGHNLQMCLDLYLCYYLSFKLHYRTRVQEIISVIHFFGLFVNLKFVFIFDQIFVFSITVQYGFLNAMPEEFFINYFRNMCLLMKCFFARQLGVELHFELGR